MGWYFRKSIGAGPFRVNLSRRGVGYSVGGRGFRMGISSGGRRYTSMSIPGTGFGYRTYGRGSGFGCLRIAFILMVLALALLGAKHLFFRP